MFKRLFDWEFWPSYMFYIPNLPYAFYLAMRARNLVFFSAANPSMKHSGNGTESKFETLKLIPDTYVPKSVLVQKHSSYAEVLDLLKTEHMNFPLIVKPDIGFRGMLVEKIDSESQLKTYCKNYNSINFIVQEFVNLPNECGIFYYRIPNEENGHITSITLKEYLSVTGNGTASLEQLVLKNPRISRHYQLVKNLHASALHKVIPSREKVVLNVIGNHCKGSTFLNGNHHIDEALQKAIDTLMKKVPRVFYGRIDLKYSSIEELKNLENFKIIEINGIISEPTHIYDPTKSTYVKALKEIRKHWKILFRVATINHSENKVPYDSISAFVNSLRELKSYTNEIAVLNTGNKS